MNKLMSPKFFVLLWHLKTKNLLTSTFVLLTLLFSQNFLQAEGSVDFRNDQGKRLFYWANEQQQIKVYAQAGEYLNLGASHIGVNGGFMMIYKPDGSFAGVYQNTGLGAGLGIINNDVEELNGPTGGGTTNGTGYVPVIQPVAVGEDGIWTIVFGFPNVLPSTSSFSFTNLENNEAWDKATNQPDQWAVVSWDVTVSAGTAANEGGTMLSGRVYTNQYKAIITGSGNATSPTFYVMTKEGVQYQLDLNNMDPYGFDFFINSTGIVDDKGQPTYLSKSTMDYTISDDPTSWTAGNFYVYEPQSKASGVLMTHKIFFNTPAVDMPTESMTANPFTNDTYSTWLNYPVNSDALDVQGFDLQGVDAMGNPTCLGNNMQVGLGGVFSFNSNVAGVVKLSLDLNSDGDFEDAEDRVIYQTADAGSNDILWDGLDGTGGAFGLVDDFEINYLLEMRAGEIHLMVRDVENNDGGITFTRLNGANSPSSSFYYDHTELGGTTSGGAAPAVTATTIPYTYDSNWGNNKMLDYWTYQDVIGNASGTVIVDIVTDCARPVLGDTDLDGIFDDVDLDDDNDGIPDAMEYCNPTGGFACFDNSIDPSGDNDGDLVSNYLDTDDPAFTNPCVDADANGVCDGVDAIYDTDGDGVPDHLDLDSDNDGIPDMVEAGHYLPDANQDARIDGLPADFGLNGLYNGISDDPDANTATILYGISNTNNNNTPDHDDLDSDDDGIFDVVESPQADGDFDGRVGTGNPEVDRNGLAIKDGNGTAVVIIFAPKNLDGDAFPDYQDWDRDGDGIADFYECPNQMDCIDSDGDGNFDVDELDSDGDGLTDMEECPTGSPCPDLDGNMVDDFREVGCPDFGVIALVADDETICEGEVLGISTTSVQGVGVSYEWFYNNGTANFSLGITNAPNYYINFTNPSHTGAYSVQVRSGICVSEMSNAVNINVYSISPPIATNESSQALPVCEGENAQLNVPYMVDATYEWHGPNGFTSTQYDPVILGLTSENAGSYYAVVTMSGGCATLISTNTTLFVQATPAPAAVEDMVAVCEGNELALTANPLGVPSTTEVNFEWFYQDGTSVGTTDSTTLVLSNITDGAAGNYYVVMTVANCVANTSDMVQVNITSTDIPNAGNDMTVCGLGNSVLSGGMPTVGQGEWTSPTGATIEDAANPQTEITNLSIGNNVFVWTLSNGNCEDYAADTVVLNYNDVTNDVAQAGDDFGVCDSPFADLGGTSPVTAFGLWSQPITQAQTGVVITNTTAPTPVVEGLVAGNTYTFTWTLSQGTCFNYDSDEVTITVSETPSINAHTEQEQYTCGDNQATILGNTPTVGTGEWMTTSTATIVNNQDAQTIVDDLSIGASMFVWTLSRGACENYDADTLVVFREESIEVEDDNYVIRLNEILTDEDVLVNDFIGFVNEYEVNITQQASMGTVTMVDGIFTYAPRHNAYGTDQFEYEVCNINCPDECEKAVVNIKLNGLDAQGDCWIPTVLTPNGNGKNDVLIIPCTENFPNNELMIFNRWGDKVFSVESYQNDWEGKYNGKDLPAGTYYYIFKLDTEDTDPIQGFFTIVR